jgi:hypothetical protein
MTDTTTTNNNTSSSTFNLATTSGYNLITRTKTFSKLVHWAFTICDTKKEGRIGKSELYAGILLVHLTLAKYAGPAACYPPTIDVVYNLFDAADDDNSGTIDEEEFQQIVIICFGQITSRILVYYLLIIVMVPYVASGIISIATQLDNIFNWNVSNKSHPVLHYIDNIITFGALAQKIVSTVLFAIVVPKFFDWIDKLSHRTALQTTIIRPTTTTDATSTTTTTTTKKDD